MKEVLLALLRSRRVYMALIALNVIVGGALCLNITLHQGTGADAHSYLALANGILHGNYSMYWDQPNAFPDTFRAPGYPAYLALFIAMFGSWRWAGLVQVTLFVLSIHLMFRVMERFGFGTAARNVFLLLLLSSQNVVMYVPLVNPEVPALACLVIMTFHDPIYRRPHWFTGIAMGLLAGFVFQCRPVFLLLPVVRPVLDLLLFRKRIAWSTNITMLLVFGLTLLPFSLWNNQHHGVFRPTPLEGGGGVFHFGYWSGRIPDYHQHRYWGNFTADEMIRFVPEDSVPRNIIAFEKEWDSIDSALAPFLTAADTQMLAHYQEYVNEKTFNARYTLERERILKRLTIEHSLEHPWYTLAFKCYTAVRLWVIGIDRGEFVAASALGKLKMSLPFLVTFTQFVVALLCIPMALKRRWLDWRELYPLLWIVLYGWLISIPFTIQSRYTVPLRFHFFVLTAMAVVALLERKRYSLHEPKPRD